MLPAPGRDRPADAFRETEKPRAPEPTLAQQRDVIFKELRSRNEFAAITTFTSHMSDFEARAIRQGISEREVIETYKEIQRILQSPEAAKLCSTVKLAREVLRNASEPTSIDQGQHPTCNVTSYECRLYARSPLLAARLVADVATGAGFQCEDGTLIKPKSIQPDDEARKDVVPNHQRNYASQLFQLTAINIYWNRQASLPEGTRPGRGNIHYCQDVEKGPAREYLLDCSKEPPQRVVLKIGKNDSPHIGLTEISAIDQQITRQKPQDLGIIRQSSSPAEGIIAIESHEQFQATLTRLKQENKFPVLLHVDANLKPFGSQDESTKNTHAPHLVSITDFDPQTGLVSVDNQWGSENDFTGKPGQKPKVPVEELFKSTKVYTMSGGEVWDEMVKHLKKTTWQDVAKVGVAGITTDLAWRGAFGSYPTRMIQSGLYRGYKAGIPGSLSALEFTHTTSGRLAMRGATTLSTLALVYAANDVHSAFKRSTEEGVGRLVRLGEVSALYEAGAFTGLGIAHLTRLNKIAGAKWGLAVTCGIAAATVYDGIVGEPLEIVAREGVNYLRKKITGRD